jgi:ribonuclease HI
MNGGKAEHRTVALRDNALNVFTDGSCLPRPRRGGIGIVVVTTDVAGEEVVEPHCLPGHKDATNNQMELLACVKGLELARDHPMLDAVREIWIYTDSMYVTENLNNAKFRWPKLKWQSQTGRPIENVELWKDLTRELLKLEPRRVEIRWVKGHSKTAHNKLADKLAKQSAAGVLRRPLRVNAVRQKKTNRPVTIGSVKMQGQTMSVRIVTGNYMKSHRLWRHMYEVLTEDSPYHGSCDYIFSTSLLHAGHHYKIRVNNATDNPRVVEVLGELDRTTGVVLEEGK